MAYYCMGCMRPIQPGETRCPVCGRPHGLNDQPAGALPQGAQLHDGRYLVGKCMGKGGFGFAYIGLDTVLKLRVAIKEFYPTNVASREPGSGTVFLNSLSKETWNSNRESFVKEAQNMAKIHEIPSVVHVRDLFYQNNTAYIVMDYVDGETVKNRLSRMGIMSWEECRWFLFPIMTALEKAHEQHLIHRDVSPDNIMIDQNGAPWLLDLGAAKELPTGSQSEKYSQTTHLVVKSGFSPPEQYTESGKIGAWTDVYAMCATILYCLTGKLIPDAMSRLGGEKLVFPEDLPAAVVNALEHGLALIPEERTQSMAQLMQELDAYSQKPDPDPRIKRLIIILGSCAAAVVVITLALILLLPRLNAGSAAAAAVKYVIHVNNAEVSGYSGSETMLELPGEAEGRPVTVIAAEAFANNETLEEVAVPEGVTRIGSRAFAGCTALKKVVLPESLESIEDSAFEGCTALKELELPQGVALGTAALAGCTKLTFITLTGDSVPADLLKGCTSLRSVLLSPETAVIGEGAFADCSALTDIRLPRGVTELGSGAFAGCGSLQSVELPETLREIRERTFADCVSLGRLELPGSIRRIGSRAFAGCTALESIEIPGGVEEIGSGAFSGCSSLRGATLSSLTGVAADAFESGAVLTFMDPWTENIMMADVLDEAVPERAAAYPVFGSSLLRGQVNSVTFLNTLEEAPESGWWDISRDGNGSVRMWWTPFGGGADELYNLYIAAEGGVQAPVDCTGLFDGYTRARVISFSGAFHTENVNNMSEMFRSCQSLGSLDLSGFDTGNVTDMYAMFQDCSSMEWVEVGSFDTQQVVNMNAMFCRCTLLGELHILNFVTASVTDMSNMFRECRALEKLELNFNTTLAEDMSYMFCDCERLKTITGLENFNTRVVNYMNAMFCRCGAIESLTLKFNTTETKDMSEMFSECTSLSYLDISSFNTAKVEDMQKMFYRCGKLKDDRLQIGARFVIPQKAKTTDMVTDSQVTKAKLGLK